MFVPSTLLQEEVDYEQATTYACWSAGVIAVLFISQTIFCVIQLTVLLPFQEIASDILNNAEHFENHDVDQLLLISKLALFSKIDQVAKDVIRTRTFRGNTNMIFFNLLRQLFHYNLRAVKSSLNDPLSARRSGRLMELFV